MSYKTEAITGKVTMAPWLMVSSKGLPYCKFTLLTPKDKAITCLCITKAGNGLAARAEADLVLDAQVLVIGNTGENGTFFVSSYEVRGKAGETKAISNPRKVVYKNDVEDIMDALGPEYVTKRLREFLGRKPTDTKVTKNLFTFSVPAYKALIQELRKEANLP
jgi:hypothetical protein